MAARKPSSVFVIAESPNSERNQPGMPPTTLIAWRIPIEGKETVEDVVARCYQHQPIGTTLAAVEDTKVTAYSVGVKLDPIDDVRIVSPTDLVDAKPLGLEPEAKP